MRWMRSARTSASTVAQTGRVFRAADALACRSSCTPSSSPTRAAPRWWRGHRGLSADHLEHLGADGIAAMAAAGTVAVLLPGAFYFLRETRLPPVQALRDAGVPIAVATDCNPGTSPLASLLAAMNMACTLFRLTPLEAIRGTTLNAARALGIAGDAGSLAPGKWAISRCGTSRGPPISPMASDSIRVAPS